MQQERQEATSPFYREGFGEAESLSPTSHKPHVNATVQIKLSNSKSTTLSIFGQQIQTLLFSLYPFFFFSNHNISGLERSLEITGNLEPKNVKQHIQGQTSK